MTETVPPQLPRLLEAFYPRTPPYYNRLWASWWVSSDAGVRQVLTDSRLSAAHGAPGEPFRSHSPLLAGMQASNDGRYDDLRRAVAPGLTLTAIGSGRFTRIPHIATGLLDGIVERRTGQVDLVEEYARPLAAYVTCMVMGLPHEVAANVWRWLDDHVDGAAATHPRRPWDWQWAPWLALLQQRRAEPHSTLDDLVDYLLKLQAGGCKVDGRRMADEDIARCCTTLMAVGAATVAAAIAGTVACLNHHDLIDAVRADPRLVAGAVREALRREPPLPTVRRRARADVQVDGQLIRAGEWVTGCLLAANHDPGRFPDPGAYKPDRPQGDDLAFGLGEHRCPGEELAAVQVQTGVGTLIRRLPGLKVDPTATLTRRWPALVPALVALPCRFDLDAAIAVKAASA